MSTTFFLACPETKKRIWLGEGDLVTFMSKFYSKDKRIMTCLADFLNDHMDEKLIFANIEDLELDYTDYCYPNRPEKEVHK